MRGVLVAAALATIAFAQRAKLKDILGSTLIDLADVGESCTDSYTGFAIIEGSLERCENVTAIQMIRSEGNVERLAEMEKIYEEFKCKFLRVHGEMVRGKCVCKDKYMGPICNEYEQCPDETPSLYNFYCTKNGCANDGIMAIGTSKMECICKGEWDGRFCERLACWRLTAKGYDKRYRNALNGTKCECGVNYEGDNCSILKSCEKTGQFDENSRRCVCDEGWAGETCGTRCPHGTASCEWLFVNGSTITSFILPLLAAVFPYLK